MIRSELCIYRLADGHVESVLTTPRLIEAPNWAPDGGSLLVNGHGRLFRVDLENPDLANIDTDFAERLNNDHGISLDGRTIVISDSSRTEGSCIYTLPATGGTPLRITANTPSWWHGWSPDGKSLTYVGRRDGVFDIYTIPASGGEERRLTRGGGHHDGPDYTPDGEWIWFNSDVGGSMQLWRIRPDGTGRERMTDDERVNWFPHPSPDGRHVLYLSYPPGTEGHPRDLDVELRLMPAGGGAARSLIALFGGQGSVNVPCWAPEGNRFAFVRYRPAA
ncbi:hypothetical protein [Ostreiculturibacter nitratireducens]|uniref:TolB family protein n=1 Tax=Ostreiculturibacter nitratireducens TaxID=3075226 RepID=UPI0031B57745